MFMHAGQDIRVKHVIVISEEPYTYANNKILVMKPKVHWAGREEQGSPRLGGY